MNASIIDTHAHIYLKEFKPDLTEVMHRAAEAQVEAVFMPNIDHQSIDDMLETEQAYAGICHAMIGLHPCSVKKDFEKELYRVEGWLARRKFAGIGECGLDLYWDKASLGLQQEALKIQIELAKKYQTPIILHTRDAFEETFALIEAQNDHTLTGVFHCFSGTKEQAEKVSKLDGFYLGIGGVATYKNSGMTELLPEIELDHLVIETDSPYLTPVPHRGKRNEPAFTQLVAKKIAELKKTELETVQAITTRNAKKLFAATYSV